MIKQTAGRDALNDFAPEFARLNDDVLFGEVWSREDQLAPKLRSMITVTALVSKGIVDSSLQHHLASARKNGVTRTEMAELLTHLAFMPAGPMHGQPFVWQKKSMQKMSQQKLTAAFSVRASQIRHLPNISQETAT